MVTAWVALGSNLGDRQAHLAWAVEQLGLILHGLRCSSFLETTAQDVPDPQPDYLNAVVTGQTSLSPESFLRRLQDIEQRRGRQRRTFRGARTLDLDLLSYGDLCLDQPGLVLPHPRFRQRRFVLEPMAELDPAWTDPLTGKTVSALLAELPVQSKGA